jgi:hypothetical protein
MNEHTPKRWREDGGPALLDDAREAHGSLGPSDEMLASMLANVQTHAGAATPHFDAGHAAPVGTLGAPLGLKLGAVLVAAAVAVGTFQLRHGDQAPAHSVPAPRVVHEAADLPPPEPAKPAAAPITPAVSDETSSHVAPPRSLTPPRPKRVERAQRVAPVSEELAPASAASPLEELALLRRARRALAHDPLLTLSLADEHATQFLAGTFVEEREVLAVEALVALDRRAEAEQRAAQFRSTHPTSLHLRRIDVVLSEQP